MGGIGRRQDSHNPLPPRVSRGIPKPAEQAPRTPSFSDIKLPPRTPRQTRRSLGGPLARGSSWFKKLFYPHPLRKTALYLVLAVVLVGGGLALKGWWAARQIIVEGGGAVALSEDVDPSQLKGEGDGRINILLIGIGGEGHEAGNLADSIQLLSIDPVQKGAVMVNLPRDLYVEIPGFGSDKINAAHAFGEEYTDTGGPKLLKETVSNALGIPIHYHARIDFSGFKEAVNTVGGIDVNVAEAIYDYAYPDSELAGFDSFTIDAGLHHMDGETALKYARSRHSTSDFDRSRRQQQVLAALKDKALSIGTLSNPAKVSGLISSAGQHFQTDVQLSEIKRFSELAKKIDTNLVRKINLNNEPDNYLASASLGGASTLVPRDGDFTEVRRYLRAIMPDGYIKRENATIRVINGTETPGLASEVADTLRVYGYNVVGVDTAAEPVQQTTVLLDATGGSKPFTINYLERRFGVRAERRNNDPNLTADVTIVVGSDYQARD